MNNFRLVRNEMAVCREWYRYDLRHPGRFSSRRHRHGGVADDGSLLPVRGKFQDTPDIIEGMVGTGIYEVSPGAPA